MYKARTVVISGLLFGCGLGVTGCEKPLFPKDLPRSPYERYMLLHGQQRPMEEKNAFGGDEPALRERLRPMGEE